MLSGHSALTGACKTYLMCPVDELLGYRATDGLGAVCLKIKDYFTALPAKASFENAYRIAALLHEIVSTDGYKNKVPWKEKDYSVNEVSSWGLSICSEPEGSTGRKNNSIFFSLGGGYISPNGAQMRELKGTMEQFSNLNVLKVLCTLYELTVSDFKPLCCCKRNIDSSTSQC